MKADGTNLDESMRQRDALGALAQHDDTDDDDDKDGDAGDGDAQSRPRREGVRAKWPHLDVVLPKQSINEFPRNPISIEFGLPLSFVPFVGGTVLLQSLHQQDRA